MHILITTQVYPPERHPTAVMIKELAQHMTAAGHAVTVAAGQPHHPLGTLPEGYVPRSFRREDQDGVTVLRGWHPISTSPAFLVRAGVMASQAVAIATAAELADRPDVVLNYGPPLIGPLFSALIARQSRARLATVIYDLYPDTAIDAGKVKAAPLVAALRQAERLTYRESSKLIVLADGFKQALMARGVPSDKIEVIPVWLDPGEIVPGPRDNRWRAAQGIGPEKFVILYAGTIGLVSGARVMLEVAEQMREDRDLLFLFVGEGWSKDQIEAEAKQRRLDNMRFLPFQPRSSLSDVQASADLSLVTLEPGRGRTSVPSKVVGYMAAARPVLASVDLDSDTANTIRAAGCGVVVGPGAVDGIVSAIRELRQDSRRPALGAAGRRWFDDKHAMPRVIAALETVLLNLGQR